jgi:hypothetical protein
MLESIPAETPKCHLGKVVKANELVSVVYDVMVKEPENGRRPAKETRVSIPAVLSCLAYSAAYSLSGEISANP